MPYILIAEDDKEINRLLCEYIGTQGYEVISVNNGLEALSALRSHRDISLCLLDIMLPLHSGDMVLKKLREFSDIPVIIISAKDTVQNKVDLLRLGADDYITKPFDLDEVLVRMETVLRRTQTREEKSEETILKFREIQMDCLKKTVTVNGQLLMLTSKEFMILELLMKNPAKLFSKANLFESVWAEPYYNEDNTLKVHMSNLRMKIKQYAPTEEYIETVWGMGYRLKN